MTGGVAKIHRVQQQYAQFTHSNGLTNGEDDTMRALLEQMV